MDRAFKENKDLIRRTRDLSVGSVSDRPSDDATDIRRKRPMCPSSISLCSPIYFYCDKFEGTY